MAYFSLYLNISDEFSWRIWLHFLISDWWQLANFTNSSFPSVSHLGKADKKARGSLLWCWQEIKNIQATTSLCMGTLASVQPPNYNQIQAISFFCSLKPSLDLLWSLFCSPRKNYYVRNKHFHTFLMYIWHHQSQLCFSLETNFVLRSPSYFCRLSSKIRLYSNSHKNPVV